MNPTETQNTSTDIVVENHGSLYLLRSTSASGHEWLDANIESDALTLGNAVVCEPRYVSDIGLGARADGLVVTWQL
jgi:hypothetical protein